MTVKIEESWKQRLSEEFEKPYFKTLTDFVRQEYSTRAVYPPAKLIFNAFDQCPFEQVKVVIVGQDPYHEPGQAHGLCFSVNDGVQIPPSLVNIYKEIHNDLGNPVPASGNLERWS
ncbi:MAG TPA: uracil-DNA glycosylase, partial [Porphyromonadaceae bacterium]|nr:uracil-DNA glycosylase [Porphyromonadaceae bacterium]HBC39367.1 uracil-DNA glycosylase [Porphyromonadaceae bacterium]HBK93502.1 uracil-DNA glycosylase [Porphyromonadaceae bacterium]HBQ57254.1 uracil-DNA glycosylase [Porphyromonadaceae bacterium]HBU45600.1 uracil-DNA glycosylase [Porphyromonadaceae bacterium]